MRLRRPSAFLAASLVISFQGAGAFADEPGGVVKSKPPVTGEEIYRQVCQACHMADAKGASGAGTIPSLAGNPRLAVPEFPITMIVKGQGAMPWLTDTLSPTQIAAVVTYVRTHFGNTFKKPVVESQVIALEKSLGAP